MVARGQDFLGAMFYFLAVTGKMETPRGRYGEEERINPVVMKHNRSKLHIIDTKKKKSCCLRRARFVFQSPWCLYFSLADGKDGSPTGVVRQERRI